MDDPSFDKIKFFGLNDYCKKTFVIFTIQFFNFESMLKKNLKLRYFNYTNRNLSVKGKKMLLFIFFLESFKSAMVFFIKKNLSLGSIHLWLFVLKKQFIFYAKPNINFLKSALQIFVIHSIKTLVNLGIIIYFCYHIDVVQIKIPQ